MGGRGSGVAVWGVSTTLVHRQLFEPSGSAETADGVGPSVCSKILSLRGRAGTSENPHA